MLFSIQGKLGFAEIFGGEIPSKINFQLDLSGNYYLIYANLSSGETSGLDVFKVLNEAYQLSLPEGYINVAHAGFFTFSSKNGEQKSLEKIFPNAPLPAIIKTNSKPVEKTACFWLTVNINDFKLFNSLVHIGYDGGTELALMGQFKSETAAGEAITTTSYILKLPDFKLFNLFEFKDLKFSFVFGENRQYKIQGIIGLKIFNKLHSFEGFVTSNDTHLKACLRMSQDEDDIENPFDGAMRGVTLKDLFFGINYTYESGSEPAHGVYGIKSTVHYGKANLFTGLLYLENTTPVLARVLIEQDINIGVLFNQSIPGGHWPENLINLIFYKGSQLYYLKKEHSHKNFSSFYENCNSTATMELFDQDEIIYQPGFNIYAKLRITLLTSIDIVGNIKITEGGIEACIQLQNPIHVYVLTICGFEDQKLDQGPKFTLSSIDKTMGFECSLLFFKENFGIGVRLEGAKIDENELEISGTLKPTQDYPILKKGTQLNFSYSDSNGFNITNWPQFDLDEKLIDFVKTLKEIANASSSECGKLVEFANEKLLTTKFKVTPSFEVKDRKLYFVLNGEYDLYVNKNNFLTADFPELIKIHISNDLSFRQLLALITNAITDASSHFVNALLKNKKAITIFLVMMAKDKAADYAASLICKGLSGSGIASAAAAGGAATAGATTAAAIAAAIAAIAKKLKHSGGDPSGDKDPKSPKPIKLAYNNALDSLEVKWALASGARGYLLQLLNPSGDKIYSDQLTYNTHIKTIAIRDIVSGNYKTEIASVKGGFISSPPTVKTMLCLPTPHLSIESDNVTIESPPVLLLKWNEIADCTGYGIKMNEELWEEKIDTLEKKITFTKQHGAGDYALSIQATGNENYINSPFSQQQIWTRLNRPPNVQVNYEQPKITVRWNAIEKSDQFKIRMVNEASQETRMYSVTGTRLETDNPFSSKEHLHISITVISIPQSDDSKQIASLWSKPVAIDIRLTPKQIAAKYYKMGSGENGETCAKAIQQAYPDIALVEIAKAMQWVEYKAEQTAIGLHSISLNISAVDLTIIIKKAYAISVTEMSISRILKTLNYNPKQIAKALKENWSNITTIRVAGILLNAVIYPRTTRKEMKEALFFAGFNALEVQDALNKYYPPSGSNEICIFSLIDIDGIIKKYTKELVAFYGYDPTIESPDDDLKQRLLAIGIGDGLFEINDSHGITPYINMVSNGKPQIGYELTPDDTKKIDGKEYLTSTFNLAIEARENDELFWYSEIINTSNYIKTVISKVSNLIDGDNPQKAAYLNDLKGGNNVFKYAGKMVTNKHHIFQETKKTHEYKGKMASKINDSRFEYILSIWVLSDAFEYEGKKVSVPIIQLNVKPNIRVV